MLAWDYKKKSWVVNDEDRVVSVGELYPWIKIKVYEQENLYLP